MIFFVCLKTDYYLSVSAQHSDRKHFRGLLEDKTALRISSMMRQVLENTDNAARDGGPSLSQKIYNRVKLLNPMQGRKDGNNKKKKNKVSPKFGDKRPSDLLHG